MGVGLTREELSRIGLLTSCREVIDGPVGEVMPGVCGERAEFILWGKLFPPEAVGPRCYSHATKHVDVVSPVSYALVDLRPLLRALEEDEDAAAAAEFTETARASFERSGGDQAVPVPSGAKDAPPERARIEFMPWTDALSGQVQILSPDYPAAAEQIEIDGAWVHVTSFDQFGGRRLLRSYPPQVISQVIHGDRK